MCNGRRGLTASPELSHAETVTAGPDGAAAAAPALHSLSLRERRNCKVGALRLGLDQADHAVRNRDDYADFIAAYEILETIGQGSTAIVKRARRKVDGKDVALKIVRSDDDETIKATKREFEILRELEHQGILKVFDIFASSVHVVLVLELFEGCHLGRAIRDQPEMSLDEAKACGLFAQLLNVVSYLHSQGIVHSDIKPENILVSRDLSQLRLVDFNFCQCDSRRAPEAKLLHAATTEDDVEAASLCAYYMLSGRRRMRSLESCGAERPSATHGSLTWEPRFSEAARACVDAGLCQGDLDRPSASELLRSAWLRQHESE